MTAISVFVASAFSISARSESQKWRRLGNWVTVSKLACRQICSCARFSRVASENSATYLASPAPPSTLLMLTRATKRFVVLARKPQFAAPMASGAKGARGPGGNADVASRREKTRDLLAARFFARKSGERGERAVDVDDEPPRVEDRHAFRTVLIDRGGEARLRLGASLGRDARIYRRAADDAGDEKQSVERREMRCDRAPVGAIIAVGEADDQRQREVIHPAEEIGARDAVGVGDGAIGRGRAARNKEVVQLRRRRRRERGDAAGPGGRDARDTHRSLVP